VGLAPSPAAFDVPLTLILVVAQFDFKLSHYSDFQTVDFDFIQ